MSTVNAGLFIPELVKKPWNESTAREIEDVLQHIRALINGAASSTVNMSGETVEAIIVAALAYKIIQQNDVPVPQRDTLNFIGAIVADDGWRTIVTIPPPTAAVKQATDQQSIDMNLRVGLESLPLRSFLAKSFR